MSFVYMPDRPGACQSRIHCIHCRRAGEFACPHEVTLDDAKRHFEATVADSAKSLVKAAGSVLAHGLSGEDEAKRREAICLECVWLDRDKMKCKACNCPIRRKIKVANGCPKGFWK